MKTNVLTLLSLVAFICCANGAQENVLKIPTAGGPDNDPSRGRQFPIFGVGPDSPPGLGPLPQYPPLNDQQPQQFNPYANGPQFPYPGNYYPGVQQNQGYPVQPQILYYQGGPGQPFLVNPGNTPGNFLIPQQPYDPNVFRNPQPYPQGPVFVAGYPKPAHIPPVEKDAEEIPQNTPKQGSASSKDKPQKLELDEIDTEVKEQPTFTNPPYKNTVDLGPGHRFFVLNRQPLFSNYPNGIPQLGGYQTEGVVNPFSNQLYSPQQDQKLLNENLKPFGSLANIILRNQPQVVQQNLVPRQFEKHNVIPQQIDGLPITLHNQVVGKDTRTVVLTPAKDNALQSRYFEKGISLESNQRPVFDSPISPYDYYKYSEDVLDDGSVIIDAKYQEASQESVKEEVETERPAESSIAQAQPGAIALAGTGGVAAAGPRGTALAGEGGLAVSSPHATAVAGPSRDEYPTPATSTTTTATTEISSNKDKKPQKNKQ